ncbi:hypothetical protein ACFX13_019624 [Malus domestica]
MTRWWSPTEQRLIRIQTVADEVPMKDASRDLGQETGHDSMPTPTLSLDDQVASSSSTAQVTGPFPGLRSVSEPQTRTTVPLGLSLDLCYLNRKKKSFRKNPIHRGSEK